MQDRGPIVEVSGVRLDSHDSVPVEEKLCGEAPLEIRVNRRPFTVTMRTPGADEELVRGLLHTEGLIDAGAPPFAVQLAADDVVPGAVTATVQVPDLYVCSHLLERRSLIAQASCGLCGKAELEDLFPGLPQVRPAGAIDASMLERCAAAMQAGQDVFGETGGCHAAAAFDGGGECLGVFEDIGRHNAVDKLVGHLLMTGAGGRAQVLFVSGRVSYEIVMKACRIGVPVLAGVSSVSSLSVEVARRQGMVLLGFCRDGRGTVYANIEHRTSNIEHRTLK